MRTRVCSILALSCAAAVTVCSPVNQESPRRDQAAVENGLLRAVSFEGEDNTYTVDERMAHHAVPGLSFALIEGGKVAWAEGYGTTRTRGGGPVDENTLFQAASISKPLTAVAAVRMRDAGLLELDADVERYLARYRLPEGAQSSSDPVTLRHLLAHTAGTTAGGYQGYPRGSPVPADLQVLRGEHPANSPPVRVEARPGERLAYSGGGYTIVEIALQDVTGKSFESLMDEWVLSVAGMRNSTFAQPLPTGLHSRAAHGHAEDGSAVEGGWRVHPEQAAAGLWSTATDLARFLVALRRSYLGEGDLLQRSSAREMLTETRDGHGIGVVLRGKGTTRTVSHAGGNVGYRAYVILYLESGDGAVFMTNADRGMDLGREMLRAASSVYDWPGFRPERHRRVAVSRDSLRELPGRYEFGEVAVEVTLPNEGSRLSVAFPNGDVYRLVPVEAGSFVHPETGVEAAFGESDGRRTLTIYGDTGVRVGE